MYAELGQNTCPVCKGVKPLNEFGKDATKASGISSWCKACKREWRWQHRKDHPDYYRSRDFNSDLKKRYGIDRDAYHAMLRQQNGQCACCHQPATNFRRGLHVDHDHTTGKIRGLLCTQCNPGLGYFQDSVERLQMAIDYLNKSKK